MRHTKLGLAWTDYERSGCVWWKSARRHIITTTTLPPKVYTLKHTGLWIDKKSTMKLIKIRLKTKPKCLSFREFSWKLVFLFFAIWYVKSKVSLLYHKILRSMWGLLAQGSKWLRETTSVRRRIDQMKSLVSFCRNATRICEKNDFWKMCIALSHVFCHF